MYSFPQCLSTVNHTLQMEKNNHGHIFTYTIYCIINPSNWRIIKRILCFNEIWLILYVSLVAVIFHNMSKKRKKSIIRNLQCHIDFIQSIQWHVTSGYFVCFAHIHVACLIHVALRRASDWSNFPTSAVIFCFVSVQTCC